ncbi:MAG: M1 family metallopeptidase [Williamsia sp.]|nr:M1 family metallopeptidase [Williamsia sp.]
MKLTVFLVSLLIPGICAFAQPDRWQQKVNYTMDVDMNVQTNRLTGKQKLVYTNNSPDTLYKAFYHLYFNAFQPNSMMDVRSRELGKIVLGRDRRGNEQRDWDPRVRDRIYNLKPDEIGFQRIVSLKMNGTAQPFEVKETILQVNLTKPILPHASVTFDMDFEAQVPLQIRRSGRDNPGTGVRYSMSQWYPKMCEYDYEGWHPTPYIAREFYGVWGDYDVKITIDKNYLLGGTGYLQNPQQIGYGYETTGSQVARPAGDKLTWHFLAPNVHDFMWAADPEYKHIVRTAPNGTTIHVIYDAGEKTLRQRFDTMGARLKASYKNDFQTYQTAYDASWTQIADAAVIVLPFIEKTFGPYPYKQYSFVHGGDGGMEYPMATLISGASLGTAFHEWMHSWYQMMMGTNESLYPWMDEGFTSYASTLVMQYYRQKTNQAAAADDEDEAPRRRPVAGVTPHGASYNGYFNLAKSGLEEPLTTHSDHYNTNYAYSQAAYSKGAVFMEQLGYITGAQVRDKILLEYYRQWHFKHPNVNDFIQVAEKVSGMKLDWYREYWVNTTKLIEYAVDSIWEEGGKTKVRLLNRGDLPMPIDLQVTYKDGSKELHYIPQYFMFGEKPAESGAPTRTVHDAWKWTHPTYIVELPKKLDDLALVEIDPTQRLADINRDNNKREIR